MHRPLRRTTPPDFGVKVKPSHGMSNGQPDDPNRAGFSLGMR
jgi:hypothetical protein